MLDILTIIQDIKDIKGLKTDKQVAELIGISPTNFNNRKNSQDSLITPIVKWAINENYSLDWLLRETKERTSQGGIPENSIRFFKIPFPSDLDNAPADDPGAEKDMKIEELKDHMASLKDFIDTLKAQLAVKDRKIEKYEELLFKQPPFERQKPRGDLDNGKTSKRVPNKAALSPIPFPIRPNLPPTTSATAVAILDRRGRILAMQLYTSHSGLPPQIGCVYDIMGEAEADTFLTMIEFALRHDIMTEHIHTEVFPPSEHTKPASIPDRVRKMRLWRLSGDILISTGQRI